MDIANFKLQIAKVKFYQFSFCSSAMLTALSLSKGILPFALLVLSGCVAMQVGGEVQHGRAALMFGDPKVALAHFQRAAELDPDYRYDYSILSQGVWTYVGRAYYATGKLSDARKALERARSRYGDDDLAKLYLGLTLARDGDRPRGLKEITLGLRGLDAWFNYLDWYHPEARFWDPGRTIRAEIQRRLKTISGEDINWSELIAFGESLGKTMEEEIDLSYRQRIFEERHDGDDRDGKDDK